MSTLINALVVLGVGPFISYVTIDRHRQLRQELKADIRRLEGELSGLKGEIGRLEGRMDAGFNAVRSDLTAVALAVGAGAGPSRETGPS